MAPQHVVPAVAHIVRQEPPAPAAPATPPPAPAVPPEPPALLPLTPPTPLALPDPAAAPDPPEPDWKSLPPHATEQSANESASALAREPNWMKITDRVMGPP